MVIRELNKHASNGRNIGVDCQVQDGIITQSINEPMII